MSSKKKRQEGSSLRLTDKRHPVMGIVAAFLGNRKISEREAKEIKAMIDSHREHS